MQVIQFPKVLTQVQLEREYESIKETYLNDYNRLTEIGGQMVELNEILKALVAESNHLGQALGLTMDRLALISAELTNTEPEEDNEDEIHT